MKIAIKTYFLFTFMKMKETTSNINLFIAYSRNDQSFLDEFIKNMSPLKRRFNLNIWSDREIDAGNQWKNEINKYIKKSDILIFLVSPDSLASDYFFEIELKKAIERHEKKEAVIVPVILRSCSWQMSPFAHIQVLPEEGKPIKSSHWFDEAYAYTSIVKGIEKIIVSILEKKALNKNLSIEFSNEPVEYPKLTIDSKNKLIEDQLKKSNAEKKVNPQNTTLQNISPIIASPKREDKLSPKDNTIPPEKKSSLQKLYDDPLPDLAPNWGFRFISMLTPSVIIIILAIIFILIYFFLY